MIVDYQNDPAHAALHFIYDVATHEPIDIKALHIWHADDERGIIRTYLFDEHGDHLKALLSAPDVPLTEEEIDRDHALYRDGITYLNPQLCLAWKEEKRPIHIVRKVEHVR